MPHPFEWKRTTEDFFAKIKKKAEKKFPGNKHGVFVAPDGSLAEKTSDGKITIKGIGNTRGIILKRENNFFYN